MAVSEPAGEGGLVCSAFRLLCSFLCADLADNSSAITQRLLRRIVIFRHHRTRDIYDASGTSKLFDVIWMNCSHTKIFNNNQILEDLSNLISSPSSEA